MIVAFSSVYFVINGIQSNLEIFYTRGLFKNTQFRSVIDDI